MNITDDLSRRVEELQRQEKTLRAKMMNQEVASRVLETDKEFRKMLAQTSDEDLMKQIDILQKSCKKHIRYDQKTFEEFFKARKSSKRFNFLTEMALHGAMATGVYFLSPAAVAGYVAAMFATLSSKRDHQKTENMDKVVLGRLLEMEHHFLQRFNPNKQFRTAIQFDDVSDSEWNDLQNKMKKIHQKDSSEQKQEPTKEAQVFARNKDEDGVLGISSGPLSSRPKMR